MSQKGKSSSGHAMTIEQAANAMGISMKRADELERQALRKMRRAMEAQGWNYEAFAELVNLRREKK